MRKHLFIIIIIVVIIIVIIINESIICLDRLPSAARVCATFRASMHDHELANVENMEMFPSMLPCTS